MTRSTAGVWADGAIVSTVDDLARFYEALLSGELLEDELLREMLRTVPADEFGRAGLGIFRRDLRCGYAWGHGGVIDGYLSEVLASKDGTHIVVIVANGNGSALLGPVLASVRNAYCIS